MSLPKNQSAFLWGARKTGKSTYLKETYPHSVYYDFLLSDSFLRYSKEPYLFREEILALDQKKLALPIIVDEVQKIPQILDEVHWLIENSDSSFILCGSSARKMKQSGVNLLGGRAWSFHFYPLVYPEITDFDLLKVFNRGTIPSHYATPHIKKSLKAYVEDYLTQEIKAEGLVRNLPAFARFLDSVGFSCGEMVNYTNISRECGVDVKTVKEYYQILIDTLLGYYVWPYRKKVGRQIISSTPKFYLFDVGVSTYLSQNLPISVLKGENAGKALEQYIYQELIAYKTLYDLDFKITYWRTKTKLEVDFILGKGDVAIEIKISNKVRSVELKGLKAFAEEHSPKQLYVVSLEPNPRKIQLGENSVLILPVKDFLKKLWDKEIL